MPKPAPYSPTDEAEQRALTIFKYLIDPKFIKEDIRSRDKYPNTDGIIEIVDANQSPLGKLEAQVRTLKRGKRNYSCPVSLVEYSKRTSLPLILICVDVSLEKAFWKHITPLMPEYENKEGQQSFTVYFSEVGNSIDQRGVYIQKWTDLVTDYQERIAKFQILRTEIGDIDTVPMEREEREIFQRYIDSVNNLLDNELKAVKYLLLPNVWKLGVGLKFTSKSHFGFEIYKVNYSEASVLVCRIKGSSIFSEGFSDNTISEIYCNRESLDDPENAGRSYVLKRLSNVVENRGFAIYGRLLASEIIYNFIKRYYRCLGLDANFDNYSTSDLDHALNFYLLGMCAAYVNAHNLDMDTAFVPIDLDEMSHYLAGQNLSPLPPGTSPVVFKIDSKFISMRSVSEALNFLVGNEIKSISRPFVKRKPGAGLIWDGFSLEDEIESVTTVLSNIVLEYKSFLQGNKLHFPNSHFLDEKTSIIFEYKPAMKTVSSSRPALYQHLVKNSENSLPKILVFTPSSNEQIVDLGDFPTIRIKGNSYHALTSSAYDATFLFRGTPVYDMLYKMLRIDIFDHFDFSVPERF